jgi:hypothetical protein
MPRRHIFTALLLWASCASATTLEQLTVDQMIQQSTAIVRAKVTASRSASRNGTIYTYYRLQVTENLKSTTPATSEVAVPGGIVGNAMQSVAGAPTLTIGSDYVLFLWTSRSGLTQIIGLSQGAFDLKSSAGGGATLLRSPSSAQMLNSAGQVVTDKAVSIDMESLRARLHELVDLGGRP